MGHLPKSDVRFLKTDWTGLVLLILAVGSLQMVLDQGQTRDWFNSRFIQIFTGVFLFSTIAFFMRGWNNPKNIVDLSLLKDRNFTAGLLAITAYGVTLFGSIALLPLLTQRLLGYPAMSAGMLFIPRAVASAIALSITGNWLMNFIDARVLVAVGIVLSAVGTMMMANLSLNADAWAIAAPGILAGIGMGLFFVPLTAVAFGSVSSERLDEAAGLYALMRGIGASIGIAVVSWLFVRQGQVHWTNLINHINPFNPALAPYVATPGVDIHSQTTAAAVAREIGRQAQMLAFVDLFWFIGLVTFAIMPLLFLMKKPREGVFIPAHAEVGCAPRFSGAAARVRGPCEGRLPADGRARRADDRRDHAAPAHRVRLRRDHVRLEVEVGGYRVAPIWLRLRPGRADVAPRPACPRPRRWRRRAPPARRLRHRSCPTHQRYPRSSGSRHWRKPAPGKAQRP